MAKTTGGEPRTIHAFFLTEQNEFQREQVRVAETAASRLGLVLKVRYADSNALVQIHQLFDSIHGRSGARPDAILVETVTGDGLGRVARNAAAAGIGWAVLNSSADYLGELRAEYPELPIFGVRVDNVRVGELMARQVRRLLRTKASASVLCVEGPPQSAVAQERLRGFANGLGGPDLTVARVDADWTVDGARASVASWLRLGRERVDIVVGQNDEMASGAREAIGGRLGREALARIPFIGCDGLPGGGRALVRSGALAATVVTGMPSEQACEALAAFYLRGEWPPEDFRIAPDSFPPLEEFGTIPPGLRRPSPAAGRAAAATL